MSEDVQWIKKDGKTVYAVVPFDEYRRLVDAVEDTADTAAYDTARSANEGEEEVPGHVVERLLRGDHPVKVWREHRGLRQRELAERIGVSPSFLSQIESGRKEGRVATWLALARELGTSVEVLVEWRDR